MPRQLNSRSLSENAITADHIATGAVTAADIADASITADKLAPGAAVPSQTGNAGKYLVTDGSNASWGTVTQTQGMVHGFNTDPSSGTLSWVNDVTAITDGDGEDLYESIIVGTDDMTFTVDDNGHLIMTIN